EMIRRIVLVTITSMLLVLATTAASASETAATDPDSLETTSEDIVFIWPPTEMCPGPDEETVWQCFNVKNDGEDVAIISQSISPGFPGLSFNATTTDVEARLLCNGTPLVLASTYDGP